MFCNNNRESWFQKYIHSFLEHWLEFCCLVWSVTPNLPLTLDMPITFSIRKHSSKALLMFSFFLYCVNMPMYLEYMCLNS